MISPTDVRILKNMLEKVERIIRTYQTYGREEIERQYEYSDSIQYEFEKLYFDSTRLSGELRVFYPELHIDDLRGMRNRIAHDYESVSLNILFDTIENDLPKLEKVLRDFLENN